MSSMPDDVNDIFFETSPFCPVHGQSVEGADIFVAPIH